jgi:hypothetical protein
MRRRKLLVALAGLAVVIVAGVVVLWPWAIDMSPGVTLHNFVRLKEGMTLSDVATILGPPGDHTSPNFQPQQFDHPPSEFGHITDDYNGVENWISDEARVVVITDRSGRTIYGWCNPNRPADESKLQTALRWARRQWHRWFP